MRGFPTLLLAWHVVCLISKSKCAPEHSRRCEWSRHNQVCTSLTGRHIYSVAKLSLVRPTGTKADRLWLTPWSFISDFSSQDCTWAHTSLSGDQQTPFPQNLHDITICYTYFVCNQTAEKRDLPHGKLYIRLNDYHFYRRKQPKKYDVHKVVR